jgi:ABC-type transport system substrate-binding protein
MVCSVCQPGDLLEALFRDWIASLLEHERRPRILTDIDACDASRDVTSKYDATIVSFTATKLRHGVKFHDVTDFNADAVIWNLERYLLFQEWQPAI